MRGKRFVWSLAGAPVLAALWLSVPSSRAIYAQTHVAAHDQAGALTKVVREATARFHDVKVAEAEG
jgi:hypothetical protein